MASTSQKTTLCSSRNDSSSLPREAAASASLVQDWTVASSDQPPKNPSITSLIRPVESVSEPPSNLSSKGTFVLRFCVLCFVLMFLLIIFSDHLDVRFLLCLFICYVGLFSHEFAFIYSLFFMGC